MRISSESMSPNETLKLFQVPTNSHNINHINSKPWLSHFYSYFTSHTQPNQISGPRKYLQVASYQVVLHKQNTSYFILMYLGLDLGESPVWKGRIWLVDFSCYVHAVMLCTMNTDVIYFTRKSHIMNKRETPFYAYCVQDRSSISKSKTS